MSGTPVGAAPVDDPAGTVLALDFDGTLSHIVEDPSQAFAHPDSVAAMSRLGAVLGGVTVITGRPVAQALELGRFVGRAGLERLTIHGQYGAEHWDAATGGAIVPDRPDSIATLSRDLPDLLATWDAAEARIEDKGLALAVHTRGLEPRLSERLTPHLRELAVQRGLSIEPGREVVELRASSADKGRALRQVVNSLGARTVVYAGDDLGDLPAFDAVDGLRAEGLRGFLVCSASTEQDALVPRADLVLDGPDAVAEWLTDWADRLGA